MNIIKNTREVVVDNIQINLNLDEATELYRLIGDLEEEQMKITILKVMKIRLNFILREEGLI